MRGNRGRRGICWFHGKLTGKPSPIEPQELSTSTVKPSHSGPYFTPRSHDGESQWLHHLVLYRTNSISQARRQRGRCSCEVRSEPKQGTQPAVSSEGSSFTRAIILSASSASNPHSQFTAALKYAVVTLKTITGDTRAKGGLPNSTMSGSRSAICQDTPELSGQGPFLWCQ